MSKMRDAERWVHILDAIRKIDNFFMLSDQKNFLASEKDQSAVSMQLAIIGEAARNLTPDFCLQHSEIPWAKIVGMRNYLVHDYTRIDYGAIWETTQNDLPLFKAQITSILAKLQPQKKPEKTLKNPKI